MREQISNFFKKTDDLFFRKVPYQVYLFGCLLVLGIVGQLIYDYNHQDNSAAMLKDFKVELSGDDFVSAKDNEDNKDEEVVLNSAYYLQGVGFVKYTNEYPRLEEDRILAISKDNKKELIQDPLTRVYIRDRI